MNKKPKYGYMCKTDWEWEIGEALGGNKVFASEKDCHENRKCVNECGMVRVKIVLDKVVMKERR